jgi:hypothetical protein
VSATSRVGLDALTYKGGYHPRKRISEETRAEDERLRKELRTADISKLKRLMKPLIVKPKETIGRKKKGG